MSFITEILNDFKRCCCPFLLNDQTQREPSIQQQLIEMKTVEQKEKKSGHQRKSSRKRIASCTQVLSGKDQNQFHKQKQQVFGNMVQSQGAKISAKKPSSIENLPQKRSDSQEKPFPIKRVQSGKLLAEQRKSGSESSFQTIKSTASRQISRRNFKILRQSSSFYAKHRSNEDQFHSVNDSDNNSINGSHINRIMAFKFVQHQQNRDGIDLMNVWIKKQYQPYPMKSYRPHLSEITIMKLQTKDVFDSMVHKLQDYYTFYFEDQNFAPTPSIQNFGSMMPTTHNPQDMSNLSLTYEQKNHQMLCSVTKTSMNKSFDYEKTCKFMSLIIIPRCSLQPLAFLQWFNRLQIQSSLHNFNKIQYIQNSQKVNQKLTLQYPLVRVEQFNEKLVGKETFMLARQIEVVNFQNQEDKQTLLQSCFQAIDQQKCFERLVRVTALQNEGCRAQIYIQSSENICKKLPGQGLTMSRSFNLEKNFEFEYFQERWKRFQDKMNKDHVINKKYTQILYH